MVNKDHEEILSSLQESGEASKLMEKLMKEKSLVKFNTSQMELDMLEADEIGLKNKMDEFKDDESKKELLATFNETLNKISDKKAELLKNVVKAYLVPLKYREMRIVQTAISEAMFSVDGMDFETDVKMLMVMQEKKLMTVFLSLRKIDDSSARYFARLEDIIKVSSDTIEYLYTEYIKEFLLTDDERKKS